MNKTSPETPLAKYVRDRLAAMEIIPIEFCRRNKFDQGLLSKIQNSQVRSLTIETVLKLSIGLGCDPGDIFSLIERQDLSELVIKAYGFGEKNKHESSRS